MLQIAGIFSITVSVVNFGCIYFSMKISMAFETIHTIIQVQNLVIVILGFAIIYAGSVAKGFYEVPLVSEVEPEILPIILLYTGVAMIVLAYLGFYASKFENERLLTTYIIFSILLLINFVIFTMMLNFSSIVL